MFNLQTFVHRPTNQSTNHLLTPYIPLHTLFVELSIVSKCQLSLALITLFVPLHSPSWLPQSQSGPLTTLAPVKFPFTSNFTLSLLFCIFTLQVWKKSSKSKTRVLQGTCRSPAQTGQHIKWWTERWTNRQHYWFIRDKENTEENVGLGPKRS